ncbi:MAG: HlyD family efflux transporter periplasmic adaptor subunit [Bacteroidetes bacterium]|jgi:membrane fusion protein, multidrug efflux system|nr:HlyD family efflux transporter periplasmic adaptor subunit [Bacteroidota bacterium]MBT7143074.1 HlyD family efflux transporter periplasmic adaptor subunit [Bacteroidota bacterium]MBT7491513.1 HlyD family efflux transporter periplasmic adaptor subunit [Bacteroidota bacterium]
MNKRVLTVIISIIAILTISVSMMMLFASMKEEQPRVEKEEMKKYIKVESIKYSTLSSSVEAHGRLESRQYIDLSAEVQGKILSGKISLKKGQSFKKGDLLMKIYSEEFILALQSKKSRFLNSIANLLPDLKIDYPNIYEEWSDFFVAIKMDKPLPEIPETKTKQEKIFLASRNILSDYFSIKSDEIRLQKYSIYAPFNGSYTDVFAETGAIASPGIRLATIIRTDELELEVPLEIENAKWVRVGQEVEVIAANHKLPWKGKVVRKANYVDPTTQSVSIFIKIVNNKNLLLKGQYLKARFTGIEMENVMEIQRSYVNNNDEVFTIEDNKLKKRKINVHKINEKTLLFSGLEEGLKIVAEALVNPIEGTEYEIIN